jgi:hypothetical protein
MGSCVFIPGSGRIISDNEAEAMQILINANTGESLAVSAREGDRTGSPIFLGETARETLAVYEAVIGE